MGSNKTRHLVQLTILFFREGMEESLKRCLRNVLISQYAFEISTYCQNDNAQFVPLTTKGRKSIFTHFELGVNSYPVFDALSIKVGPKGQSSIFKKLWTNENMA